MPFGMKNDEQTDSSFYFDMNHRRLFSIAISCLLYFFSLSNTRAQSGNSLEPIIVGVEAGTNLTLWQHATPTYFSTVYPYPPGADTVQVPFQTGATPLFGFYAGLNGNFYLNSKWSVLAKFAYAEWRGQWNSTEPIDFDTNGVAGTIPVSSNLVFMLRTVALEGYLEYHFCGTKGFYVGAGVDVRAIASSHYDLDRSITGGPANLSFVDFSTGRGTGDRSYSIGGEQPVATAIADLKLLTGIPFWISDRWSIDPEVAFDLPLMSIWTDSKQSEYASTTYGHGPEPLPITGIISLEYRAQ